MIPKEIFSICESVNGNWHYHLFNRKYGKDSIALCGAQTMWSGAPIDTWGFIPEHIPTKYCPKCEKIALSNKQDIIF